MNTLIGRIGATIVAILLYGWINFLAYPASTLLTGQTAGQQFDDSNVSYFSSTIAMRIFGHLGIPFVLLLIVVVLIWLGPLRRFLSGAAMFGVLGLLFAPLVFAPSPAQAYYDKTDYTEAYTILPNESAFWIPDVGANKDSQAQLETEAYLNANKVALKRFIVPHVHLQGSGGFFDFYVPAGRLIIVDRTPFSREWVDATDRGTSRRPEGFPCQTSEGLNVTVGVSIGASVLEVNAAKYLYRFGVMPVGGDRGDPRVIFASVYYSRKLSDVMDDVGRKKVQTLVCNEIAARSFDKTNAEANQIMQAVQKGAVDYFAAVGITLDFIGWADTFTFDKVVQDAVNRRYVANQDQAIATALAPYADTIQRLAAAQALRSFGEHSDGKLPTTIVGLPPDLGALLGTLLRTAPVSGQATPAPAAR
jgi:hypothetical protein